MSDPSVVHSTAAASAAEPTSAASPKYAEVAVPVHVSRTFTYLLPRAISHDAKPGARLVVPLHSKLVTGYIVALLDDIQSEPTLAETAIKEAVELLDRVPLVTPEVLAITRWISDYYGSPWGEVIKAALPPGISATMERLIVLTGQGYDQMETLAASAPALSNILRLIGDHGEISPERLAKEAGKTQTSRLIRELERDGLVQTIHRPRQLPIRTRHQRAIRLLEVDQAALAAQKLTSAQRRIIGELNNERTMPLKNLLAEANVSLSSVNTLEKRGIVELFEEPVRRDPILAREIPPAEEHTLTEAQTSVLESIEKPLREGIYRTFLLHGVTGSGKTEVYMRAMRVALQLGRSAMMLVPEIALTPVFSRRLRANFGDLVAIFHSSLSKGERFDEWTRVRSGEARIVIGTRSGVFAPVRNLGLVIIDEEHEATYRQQDSPVYNGRDTAIVRAQQESAVVLLGSATPSLETFHNAHIKKYEHLQLTDRIGNRPFARARIIDMRKVVAQYGRPRVFSDALLERIAETHQKKEQSIILLNRRGYSSAVLCRTCGETVQCPNCDVTLTYHRSMRTIVCHYCNHNQPAPSRCPSCEGEYIYYIGEGTEQIEEMLKAQFPTIRIARIDRDTTAHRRSFEKTLADFGAGQIDMLVGTQMLAKGHDFPNVTLVGVVSVDAGLVLPDFRAAEKTFQLITQVAGRAGRGNQPGQVLIQTYHPEHYAVRHAAAQDYAGFYEQEIRYRKHHSYPPFVVLGLLLLHGTDLGRLKSEGNDLRKALDAANTERLCRILGPAPAPLARLKGEHRYQLLVKARTRKHLRQVIDNALAEVASLGISRRSINLEIDPVSVM
ncbi:MAG TPA: primosomal protein N' [Pyrinomonadaceae bacterium]|nr:primosomal protein N' [Pyrinomonadaceae bacterium]